MHGLKIGYDKALLSGSTVRLAMPILGETGCKLAEIIGMRLDDIDMKQGSIVIRPNLARRLKTRNSTRTLPLTGYAKLAIERAIQKADGEWLFPQYIKSGKCNATHASNALNKWLKEDFDGLTAHCLRHSMRDRLRSVECQGQSYLESYTFDIRLVFHDPLLCSHDHRYLCQDQY
jgi:integrase